MFYPLRMTNEVDHSRHVPDLEDNRRESQRQAPVHLDKVPAKHRLDLTSLIVVIVVIIAVFVSQELKRVLRDDL